MKRSLIATVLLCLTMIQSSALLASGVDALSHQSAEFYMGLSRNASTDSADAAFYNPAGTAFLDDGLYLNVSLQAVLSTYCNEYQWTRHRALEPAFMPSIYLVYKKEHWAGFFAFNVPAGMGQVSYGNGIGLIKNQVEQISLLARALVPTAAVSPLPLLSQELHASGSVFGLALGGAYRFNDVVSISLGARYMPATKSARVSYSGVFPYVNGGGPGLLALTSDVEYEATGHGICGFAGIDIRPVKPLTIAVTYASIAVVYYDYSSYRNVSFAVDSLAGPSSLGPVAGVVTGQLWLQGNTQKKFTRQGSPPVLMLGAEYRIIPVLRVSSSFAYYFNGQALWNGLERKFRDGWELSLSLEYDAAPRVTLGIGGGYIYTGITASALGQLPQAANPAMPNWAISAGTRIKATDRLNVTIGAIYNPYLPRKGSFNQIRYERSGYALAIGGQYRLM